MIVPVGMRLELLKRAPSARLTHRPKLDTVLWLLRCSVLRETPMASAIHFKKLNCYKTIRGTIHGNMYTQPLWQAMKRKGVKR